MDIALYFSAFTLGFLGSFHCAGMCGPIALMLPKNSSSAGQIFTGRLLYNTGRIITYILLGIIFGLLGWAVSLKGLQKELSVLAGVIILVFAVLTTSKKSKFIKLSSEGIISVFIRTQLKKLFISKTYFSLLMIGMINGLLPCGFVYLAIAGAVSAGTIWGGISYMTLFGMGTFPMMMIISVAANFAGIKFRNIYSRLAPALAIMLALLLIYRGTDMKTNECCHEADKGKPACCGIKHNSK